MHCRLRWLLDGGVKLLSVLLLFGAASLRVESVTARGRGGRNPSIKKEQMEGRNLEIQKQSYGNTVDVHKTRCLTY